MSRRLGRWLALCLLIGLAILGGTVAAVIWRAENARGAQADAGPVAPADAAIVLGGGVDGDGVLGYSTRRRVAAAATTLKRGEVRALIMSGGPSPWTEISTARLMRDHAISLGVPADRVLIEDRAGTTFENLRFGLALARANGMEELALVSDVYHLARARALARYFGADEIRIIAAAGLEREAPPDRLQNYLREALAWWYNLGKIAAWEILGTFGWTAAERERIIR